MAKDASALFTKAINVINAALDRHKDSLPYEQNLEAAHRALAGRNLGVAVYEDDPGAPFDWFTLRFSEGGFEIVAHGKRHPELAWKVSRDYLRKLADHPDDYIENPAKLDWDWLKSRLGLD
jgi:hypothetical protein